MKRIDMNDVNIKMAVRLMMEESNYNQFKELAEVLDIPKSTLQSALDKNSLRVRDLARIADLLGYKIILEKK
ncbi:helix-turn-helix domain containing protein [Caldibacillus thermoamylovorans]|uniref:helix-turn-helix domain containing protein n=1 Tax=Caldibacillus thermoamylovorans TaxID=35841 RepID=UPI00203C823F|nr:helix-turn-helix domain containing protein [Caldibacillus thermoamylovorans]MCM3800054.1 helix-turn-helix domain containing protein [Caldibacillus thermoamylovorans]